MAAIGNEEGGREQRVPDFREIPLGPRARAVVGTTRTVALWLASHWLALANGFFSVTVLGSAVVPLMMSVGPRSAAEVLFTSYHLLCHQLPYRTFFLWGHPMAFCQRDVAIYGTMAAAGIAFTLTGRRWKPLPWRWYLALLLPIALDGTTQLFGMRESTWELRLLTGSLFGMATVWIAYPNLELFAARVVDEANSESVEYRDGET